MNQQVIDLEEGHQGHLEGEWDVLVEEVVAHKDQGLHRLQVVDEEGRCLLGHPQSL